MDLSGNPAFATFAVCSAILVFKMIVVGHYTGLLRGLRKAFLNPEDAKVLGAGSKPAAEEDIDVDRGLRAHRNDLESTLPFLAIGLVYLALDPSPGLAKGLFIGFTICRVLFSVFYLLELQPWRSLIFIVGEICVLVMLGQIVYWVAF